VSWSGETAPQERVRQGRQSGEVAPEISPFRSIEEEIWELTGNNDLCRGKSEGLSVGDK